MLLSLLMCRQPPTLMADMAFFQLWEILGPLSMGKMLMEPGPFISQNLPLQRLVLQQHPSFLATLYLVTGGMKAINVFLLLTGLAIPSA
jgi:hypothetical protein